MAPDGTGDEVADAKLARNQVIAEEIKVVTSSLLGLTVGCAQCHDHRFDPIPQTDYYRLRAIFEPAFDWQNWRAPAQRLYSLYTPEERAKAGVEIRILGKLEKKDLAALVEKYPGKLHARVIIADGKKAFVGSQSLRRLELDDRREVGVVFTDPGVLKQLVSVFESDWSMTETGKEDARENGKEKKK